MKEFVGQHLDGSVAMRSISERNWAPNRTSPQRTLDEMNRTDSVRHSLIGLKRWPLRRLGYSMSRVIARKNITFDEKK